MTARAYSSAQTFASADQELLLKALLLEGEAAIESWNAWRQRISVEDADVASQRLLPLLLDKLHRLGVDHPDLSRYESVARYTWLYNQLRARAAQNILASFAEAGVPAMPLKGLAVALLYYGDLRRRAMTDFDVLVPAASAATAARRLNSKGWYSPCETFLDSESYRQTRHAAQFINARGAEIDLHWHVSHDCCQSGIGDVFWRHSQPLTINGFETRTLSDTDHLFQACIHGGMPNEVPPIHWITDSAQILRTRSIEWQRLLDQGRDFDVVRRLQRTLGYLRGSFLLPIPDSVIAQLRAMRPSRIELLDERTRFSRLHPFLKSGVWRYIHYRRNAARHQNFFRYLQESFGTHSLAGTIFWVVNRMRQGVRPIPFSLPSD